MARAFDLFVLLSAFAAFGVVLLFLVAPATNAQHVSTVLGVDVRSEMLEARDIRAGIVGNGSSYFVFLQKFPLGFQLFYHTEILVCPRTEFSLQEQNDLDGQLVGMKDFAEVPTAWWQSKTARCVELGYGRAGCKNQCCSVVLAMMPLNKRQAIIPNADVSKKSLFIYGTGSFDGVAAWHRTCDTTCWSNWAGTDYDPLTNNCNTFTSTVLSCVYGLSQRKPHLGVSDMITVSGGCPEDDFEMPM